MTNNNNHHKFTGVFHFFKTQWVEILLILGFLWVSVFGYFLFGYPTELGAKIGSIWVIGSIFYMSMLYEATFILLYLFFVKYG